MIENIIEKQKTICVYLYIKPSPPGPPGFWAWTLENKKTNGFRLSHNLTSIWCCKNVTYLLLN